MESQDNHPEIFKKYVIRLIQYALLVFMVIIVVIFSPEMIAAVILVAVSGSLFWYWRNQIEKCEAEVEAARRGQLDKEEE